MPLISYAFCFWLCSCYYSLVIFVWKCTRCDLTSAFFYRTEKTLQSFLLGYIYFFQLKRFQHPILLNFAILQLVGCIVANIYFAVLFSKCLHTFLADFVSLVFPFIITMSCTDLFQTCSDDTSQHFNVNRCFNVAITFIQR